MAEYCSGIFYGRSNSIPNASSRSISQLGILTLPPELDLGPPLTLSALQNEEDIGKDIILLAEFSEMEGPIPILSIPKKYDRETDLNEIVLQLLSTDYHSLGRSDFQIQKDVCVLQEDPEKKLFTYVHYFILYDVRARGFVRPSCLAYITREPKKLSRYFKKIEEQFYKATEYLRVCNLQIFLRELKTRINDLQFTKERYIQVYHQIVKNAAKELESDKENIIHKNSKLDKENVNEMNNKLDRESVCQKSNKSSKKRSISLIGDPPFLERYKSYHNNSNSGESLEKTLDDRFLGFSSLSLSDDWNVTPSSLKLYSVENYGLISPSNTSTSNTQKLKNDINSQSKSPSTNSDFTLKGSVKELLLEGSSRFSDSSSTVKSVSDLKSSCTNGVFISSLMHDESVKEILNTSSEEVQVLQHTSLDSLALQLLDCQFILGVVRNYLEQSKCVSEMEQFLTDIKSNPHSPLHSELNELGILKPACDLNREPSIFVISLMRRNFRNLRSTYSLCGVGYVACLSLLLVVHRSFSKSTMTLFFENLDKDIYENPFSSLFIGNVPVINIGSHLNESSKCVPCTEKFSLKDSCWNEDLIQLLHVDLSKTSTPDSDYVDAKEDFEGEDVTVADDCLEVFNKEPTEAGKSSVSYALQVSEDLNSDSDAESYRGGKSNNVFVGGISRHSTPFRRSLSSDSSWASTTPKELNLIEALNSELEEDGEEEEVTSDVIDKEDIKIKRIDIDKRKSLGKLYHTSTLIRQFSGVSQCIIHSLLSGKTMIVAGPEYLKSVVVLYIKSLSTILPSKPNQYQPVLKWHTGTVTPYHLKLYKVIGVCIPERLHVQDLMSNATLNKVTVLNIETGHICGVAYSGSLLQETDQLSRRYFRSDVSLQVTLQSLLMTIGMKVFLHYHLLQTTTRSSNEILKGIGVPRGDWLMIQYLSRIIQEQLSEVT